MLHPTLVCFVPGQRKIEFDKKKRLNFLLQREKFYQAPFAYFRRRIIILCSEDAHGLFVRSAEKEAAQDSQVIVVDASFIVAWPIMALSAQTMRAPVSPRTNISPRFYSNLALFVCARRGKTCAGPLGFNMQPASALPCIWPFRHSLSLAGCVRLSTLLNVKQGSAKTK